MIFRPAPFLHSHLNPPFQSLRWLQAYAWLLFFFLNPAVFFMLMPGVACAGAVIQIDADGQYAFAEHYFSEGDYSRAVDEYKRFIYFFPDDPRIEQAMYQCGMAFYSGRQYADAAACFNEVIAKFSDSVWSDKSHFMLSESHIRLGRYDSAVIALHNLIAVSQSGDVRDKAYYRLGWIYIETASWDNARKYFDKIDPARRETFRLERLSAELDQEADTSGKSPALAGVLSLVPGGGQLYTQRYQDALIAFLLNGALIWAACEAFDDDNHALGALLTFVEVGFYAGNIYGAVGSAHKYNRTKTEKFIQKLRQHTKINLSGDFESKSIRLSLQLTF